MINVKYCKDKKQIKNLFEYLDKNNAISLIIKDDKKYFKD